MRNNDEIISLIKEKLSTSPLSMSELARSAGVSKSTLSRYLSKSREFPLNKADDFARVLNMTTEDFLGLTNNNVNGDQNNVATMSGDINGNVSFGSSIQKEDLHEVASNLNLTDRELQEKTLTEVSDLRASQARLESAISLLMENQANVLASMKSVDETFKKMFMEMLKELKK